MLSQEISYRIPLEEGISEGGKSLRAAKGSASLKPEIGSSFSSLVTSAVKEINALQVDAQEKSQRLLLGEEGMEVHDVTLAMLKANFSLNLAKTIVERAITAYKEVTTPR